MRTLADLGAAVVGVASRVRGERVIHAKGLAYDATVTVLPAAGWIGVPLAGVPRERSAVLRLSRAIGLPDAVPDVLGFALRIYDADAAGGTQDLLLASSGSRAVLRHVLAPRRDAMATAYTSITPLEVGGQRLLVGAFPRNARPGGRAQGSWFDLATAPVWGDWTTFAEVHIGMPLDEERSDSIGFDVAHDAGGFRSDPVLLRLRALAYPAARAAER